MLFDESSGVDVELVGLLGGCYDNSRWESFWRVEGLPFSALS
jgi:hypothetical protein